MVARMRRIPAKRKQRNLRGTARVSAVLPVRVGKAHGTTRDVSASGVFFETDIAYHRGSKIHFEIQLETPWGHAVCDCDGKIVRVERRDGAVGIAVQFSAARARARVWRKRPLSPRGGKRALAVRRRR